MNRRATRDQAEARASASVVRRLVVGQIFAAAGEQSLDGVATLGHFATKLRKFGLAAQQNVVEGIEHLLLVGDLLFDAG